MTAKKPKPPHIWAIERLHGKVWKASSGRVFTSRRIASSECNWCRNYFEPDKFRIRKYVRAEK